MLWDPFRFHLRLPIAIGSIEMGHLVREPEWAHPCLRDASAAPPGVADGEPHAAVIQPSAVTLVIVSEVPGGIKLADQRQLGALMFTRMSCLLEGESPWYVEDRACGGRRGWFEHVQWFGFTVRHYNQFTSFGFASFQLIIFTFFRLQGKFPGMEKAKYFPTDQLVFMMSY